MRNSIELSELELILGANLDESTLVVSAVAVVGR